MNSEGWLDLSGYPNIEPDQAVEPHRLEVLRDALHSAPAQPLTDELWSSLLEASALGSDPGPHEPEPADLAHAPADLPIAPDPSPSPGFWNHPEHGGPEFHDVNGHDGHDGYNGHDLHFHG